MISYESLINSKSILSLGPISKELLPQMRQWRNDHRVWKWCRQNSVISNDSQLDWYERMRKDASIKMFSIWIDGGISNQEFVGVCGFTSIDMLNRKAEFSLYIAPEEHKKGYGNRALKTLFTHGFLDFGFNSIWGETFEGNPALSLFTSIGMRLVGTKKQDYFREGKFIDCHITQITRDEWKT